MKTKHTLKRKDIYRFYKKNAEHEVIDIKDFSKILNEYSSLCYEKIVYENQKIVFPYLLGSLKIVVKEQEFINKKGKIGLAVNWGETKKLWKQNPEAKEKKILIRFLNKHSDGNLYMFFYSNLRLPLDHRRLLRFKVNKRLRDLFSKKIMNNEIKVNYESHNPKNKIKIKENDQ